MTKSRICLFFCLSLFFSHAVSAVAANFNEIKKQLYSCDSNIVFAAAEEVINDQETLSNPIRLFAVSEAYFRHQKQDKAVFWFYAAQLRIHYQIASMQNPGTALLGLGMVMGSLGPCVNTYAFKDIAKLNKTLDQVVAWDIKTSNPYLFSEKSKWDNGNKIISQFFSKLNKPIENYANSENVKNNKSLLAAVKMQKINIPTDTDFSSFKKEISNQIAELESRAELAEPEIKKGFPTFFHKCRQQAQQIN